MDRVCATSAGVNAIMLACQTVLDPGDQKAAFWRAPIQVVP